MGFIADIRKEKNFCLGMARSYAPFEYGNLRYNAISAHDTSDGFCINYSLSNAFYIYFQEEGTRYFSGNKGFIANMTLPAIASYLNAKYSTWNEDLLKYYEGRSLHGNFDLYKSARIKEYRNMMNLRKEKAYESALANMVTYGHISNEFSWKHDPKLEVEFSDLNRKF